MQDDRLAFDGRTSLDTPCDPRIIDEMGARSRSSQFLHLPTLHPPDAVPVRMSGASIGNNQVTSAADLTTTMSPAALAAHFAAQLVAAGWSPAGQADDTDVVVRRWSVPLPEGAADELRSVVRTPDRVAHGVGDGRVRVDHSGAVGPTQLTNLRNASDEAASDGSTTTARSWGSAVPTDRALGGAVHKAFPPDA